MNASRDGVPRYHRGDVLLRAVSDSLADQCPPPDTGGGLMRLQAAARDRGLLGEGIALAGFGAGSGGRQARPADADLGTAVILAEPPRRRPQRLRARPIVALAAVTAVAATVVLAALLGPRGHHRTGPSAHPPAASPTPTASPALRLRDIAGTWTGLVTQPSPAGSLVLSVKLTVPENHKVPRVSYSGTSTTFSCSGILFPVSSSSSQLALQQEIVAGPCQPGTVTLIPQASGYLKIRFLGLGAPPATGILRRAVPAHN